MAKKKIVFWNPTELTEVDYERSLVEDDDDYEVTLYKDVPDEEFLHYAADADGVAIETMEVTDEILAQMPNVKVMVRRGIGHEQFHLDAFTKHGVLACNIPGYCVKEVALHSVALALACSRYITTLDKRMSVRDGEYGDLHMYRPDNQVYGLVSFGAIARAAVPMLKGLGYRVVAWDPYLKDEMFDKLGVRRCKAMDDLLRISNIVSIHTPLSPDTYHLFDQGTIMKMKKDSILISTSRGGLIDEAALRDAVISGHIAGVGLDVLEDEDGFTTPLCGLNNVILTPHVGYYTEEAGKDLRTFAIKTMRQALDAKKYPKALLNKDVVGKSRID